MRLHNARDPRRGDPSPQLHYFIASPDPFLFLFLFLSLSPLLLHATPDDPTDLTTAGLAGYALADCAGPNDVRRGVSAGHGGQ